MFINLQSLYLPGVNLIGPDLLDIFRLQDQATLKYTHFRTHTYTHSHDPPQRECITGEGYKMKKKSPKFPFPSLCNPLNDISENLRSKIKHVSHADPCAQSRDCIGLPLFHLHCWMRIAKKSYYISVKVVLHLRWVRFITFSIKVVLHLR